MKNLLLTFSLLVALGAFSQSNNKYTVPEKTRNFSQTDWLEIMSEIVNNPSILNRMKGFVKGPIVISDLPYVCLANNEHPIVLQFCPECIWTIDACVGNGCISKVSISADSSYGFHLDQVLAQDIWNPGDTVMALLFVMHTGLIQMHETIECVLVPVISNVYVPAFAIFPDKRKGKR